MINKIIKFGSKGCGPCKLMDRTLDIFEKDFPEIKVERIDVEEETEMTSKFDIRRLPTIVYVEENEGNQILLGRTSGYLTVEQLTTEINNKNKYV